MNCKLGQGQWDIVLPGCKDEVRRVSRLQPLVKLSQTVDIFIKVGDHLSYESLEFFYFVDISCMLEMTGSGWVLHLLSCVLYEPP